jgi:sialic acid synthase SpsE
MYPTPPSQANLLSIPFLRDQFKCPVGYSDHTEGIWACIGAVALGARVIEKHFTMDRRQPLGDHRLSAEPEELKEMVERIRSMEFMLGVYGKPTARESDMKNRLRRSLVTVRSLPAGTVLRKEHLAAVRPGGGISPWDVDQIIGKTCRRDLEEGTTLSWSDLN